MPANQPKPQDGRMTELVLAVLAMGAGVFAASAAAKLRGRAAYRDYRAGLHATTLLPARLLPVTAAVLVVIETITALALAGAAALTAAWSTAASGLAESALGLAAGLSAVLAAGVAVVVRRGAIAPCACFGARASRPLGTVHVIRNTCLLFVLLVGLGCGPLAEAKAAPAGSAVALAAGLIAALAFIRWDDLAYLLAPTPYAGQGRPARQRRTNR
jgi:hypothetical protein